MGSVSSVQTSTSKVTVPSSLKNYLSETKTNSRKLISALQTLSRETDNNKLKDATQEFVKYYNKVIKDDSLYKDAGLKSLTAKLKSYLNEKSSSLSKYGVTIQSSGKIKFDGSTFDTAISNDENSYGNFVSINMESGGVFNNIEKVAKQLKRNNTSYLSEDAKLIIKKASTHIFDTYA